MAEERLARRGQLGRMWDPFRQMRELMSWDPLEELARRRGTEGEGFGFTPAFEVKETKDAFVFKGDLPGVKEDDVDISVTGNRLTISGSRQEEHKEESDTYYTYERSFGSFSRGFTHPENVNTDDIRADLKEGVLSVYVPKREGSVAKKISIKKDGGAKQAKA